MSDTFRLSVNGREHSVTAEGDTPLLYVLRNDIGLASPKYGCGTEQCGTCNVIVDGDKAFSCTLTVRDAAGKAIVTLEGLGTPENPHPVQAAFIAEQAAQCGYCTSGIMISAKVLLDRNPDPDTDAIRVALQDNLCRCGTHSRVFRAVRRAARALAR
ncbi:MAG: 2Fe-2S iron-sulfur cluster binding domain-containing protein [Alphaproteobacteria bacterium]|nr:2Fe-2S iron-sulfur cluster binding domain-containing protein [Alphaproteobacteria bacterium]